MERSRRRKLNIKGTERSSFLNHQPAYFSLLSNMLISSRRVRLYDPSSQSASRTREDGLADRGAKGRTDKAAGERWNKFLLCLPPSVSAKQAGGREA